MATDFIRIGGPIVSAPLNENFRQLRNDISMANTNLVFSDTDGVKNTVQEMLDIKTKKEGQVCYVVSTGELYRFTFLDDTWHSIADFGQTYKQALLNSGVIIMSDIIKISENNAQTIILPNMLVYFKNQPGDGIYLGGMYRVDTAEIDLSSYLQPNSTYTIILDEQLLCSAVSGKVDVDTSDIIVLGYLITDADKNIIPDLLCTVPYIAYTADRSHFMALGGQAHGLDLVASSGKKVKRNAGTYYIEGINIPLDDITKFPLTNNNHANYNSKMIGAATAPVLYYICSDGLSQGILGKDELQNTKYYDKGAKKLENLPKDTFTIQKHLVTPNGTNIIIHGDSYYTSIEDAEANLNYPSTFTFNYPYIEATRIIVGNVTDFQVTTRNHCRFYTLDRLTHTGTIDPEFADNEFLLYSGDEDTRPSKVRFSLQALQDDEFNDTYTVEFKGFKDENILFSLDSKYITDQTVLTDIIKSTETTNVIGTNPGYVIPTQQSLDNLQDRIANIEKEIWSTYQAAEAEKVYNQSIRYRLYHNELDINTFRTQVNGMLNKISELSNQKVNKGTTINSYALGDDTTSANAATEVKSITLTTGDFEEKTSANGKPANLWYKDERVKAVPEVDQAYKHISNTNNPHLTNTDNLIEGSTKFLVTRTEKNRIANLPVDTAGTLEKKIESVGLYTVGGSSGNVTGTTTKLGDIHNLKFYTSGVNITVDQANKTALIECVGQADPSDFIKKSQYATKSMTNAAYTGYVDKAVVAKDIESLANLEGESLQYYGTDINGTMGTYSLPVSTGDVKTSVNVESVAFEPYGHSITLKHLADATVIYTNNHEETELNTNVYDLVKNHYHKVYNSGVQAAYDTEGNIIVHHPYYNYIAPFGGLSERAYYFTHNSICYTFTPELFLVANTELRFYPSDIARLVYVTNDVEHDMAFSQIDGSEVEENYLLHFVSSTDWNCINEWNFGDNLTVSVVNGRATINAKDISAGGFENHFANLADVNVDYNDLNLGKLLQLSKDANGNYKIQLQEVPLQEYMRMEDYVEDSVNYIVKTAQQANRATIADSANKLQSTYMVDDSTTGWDILWSSNRTESRINELIQSTGMKAHYGTGEPSAGTGKQGDIYIMIG